MIDKNTYALAIARIAKHDGDEAAHVDIRDAISELQNTGVDTTARTAAGTALTDADEHFASENVEGALGEVGTALGTVTSQLAANTTALGNLSFVVAEDGGLDITYIYAGE